MKAFALILLALALNPAWGAPNCKAQFKKNLDEIHRRFKQLKPTCWKEVQRGEANTAAILSVCDGREQDLARAMEPFEQRNIALCQGACAGELDPLKVCIDGKPLSYYRSRLK